MSTKTNFKRIALAVVAALGLGVLASGPSNAEILTANLSLSSAASSITAGETATTVVTQTLFASAIGDSVTITAAGADAKSIALVSADVKFRAIAADSINATIIDNATDSVEVQATGTGSVSAKFNLNLVTATSLAAGTYIFDVFASLSGATTASGNLPNRGPFRWTVTVAAADVKPSAATSKVVIGETDFTTYASTATDSVIAVSAGTIGTNTPAAVVAWTQLNSKGVAAGSSESVTVRINGAGALRIGAAGTVASAVIAKFDETVTVLTDGRTGVGTVSVETTSMANWATKTLTFSGKVAKATIAVPRTVLGTYASSNAVRITPLDSTDNLVTTAVNMYLHSSDTKVVKNSVDPVSFTGGTTALGYSTGSITALLLDSGTAKIKFANFAAESTTPTTGAIVTNEVAVSVVGSPRTFTITLDKSSYTPGEIAKVTVNVFDGLGKAVADTAIASMLTSVGVTANGATTSSGDTITVAAATHGVGKYTYEFAMPTAGSDVVFKATGSTGLPTAGQVAVYETVTIVNPAEDAANEALDAAIAATDAAILAEEAAANAEAAATAAAETAEAALDAVTALSAQVTKLVAQLATLQKLVNRIAKRVGARA